MRKVFGVLILTTLLLVFVSSSVLAGGVIKVGVDVGGEVEVNEVLQGIAFPLGKNDTELGISIGGEYFFDLNENLAVGAGVEYQLNRKNEGVEEGFNNIPLYALGRYQISPSIYLTGKVGYNIFQVEEPSEDTKIKGGSFYGFGGGAVFSDMWQLEILYSVHNGKIEPKEDPGVSYYCDWKYSKIGLSVGYKF